MKIVNININEIKPYSKNPRVIDDAVEYVKKSIEKFGFKNPIILDKNKEIVCGHVRYEAAKQLNLINIPCIIENNLTSKQIKAFRIAENKTSEMARWNFDLLLDEMNLLSEFDMSDFQFNIDDFTGELYINNDKDIIMNYKITVKSLYNEEIEKSKKIVSENDTDN